MNVQNRHRPTPSSTCSRFDARASHPAKGRLVLYVCGGPEDRILFTRIARRWKHFKLLIAESGEEGFDIAVSRKPRVVILDSALTDMDGEKLVIALRQGAPEPAMPIVVLANDSAPRERARFVWAGATACHAKPLHVAEIDRTVAMLLEVASLR
jgi:DNA-binding response OmpR family regulator